MIRASFEVERVTYYRHIVRYRLKSGARRRMVHYSPGGPWVRTEVARRLDDRCGVESIAPGSVKIDLVTP